jgi:uncharacterized protein with PIN domain
LPLEEFTFFVDRSLGSVKVAGALREMGLDVVVHDDLFAPDSPDPLWLSKAGGEGWIVLTKDDKIRYRAIEREAYIRAGVRCFVFTQSRQRAEVIIDALSVERRERLKRRSSQCRTRSLRASQQVVR